MALVKGRFKIALANFMKAQQKKVQEDQDKALDDLAAELEKITYEAIKSALIKIPSGAIIVATANGPASNVQPIVLTKVIS